MTDKTQHTQEKKEEINKINTDKKIENKSEAPINTKDVSANSQSKETKVAEVKKITKKDEAIAKGNNLHASKKQCMYICRFIKNKSIDDSIKDLEGVIKMKKIVPFVGEIPHRRGKGVMSGRYPINASKLFISVLKGLKGNILVNQMDLDKCKIYFASASWASRPSKHSGGRFKRTNIILKAKEFAIKDEKPKITKKKQNQRRQRNE